jgi:hypothetical protein
MTRAAAPARRNGATGRALVRFLTGQHLDGRRRTDATFWTRGQQALEPRWFGVAEMSWWAAAPGWQRLGLRLAAVVAALGLWRARPGTEWTLALIGGPVLGLLAWRAVSRALDARHRRRVIEPLAAALASPLEAAPAELARTLRVPRALGQDAQIAAAPSPQWQGAPGQVAAVTRIVGQRLGGEWQAAVQRDPLGLLVTRRPEPPEYVTFAQVENLIRAQGSATKILMGLGAGGEPVWLDFGNLLAHLGLSCGPGAGKSTFLRFILAQWSFWGVADFPTLDGKGISLAGMEPIVGLRVYRETAEQWAVLAELRAEMERRYAAMLADPSATFPLSVVLGDEMNDLAIQWRQDWAEVRPARAPATPPVYSDWTRLLIKGRECGFRFVGSWQRLTAASCGGVNAGVLRDAIGTKALSRFSVQAFDSLVGIRPVPPSSQIPGRWIVAAGQEVRQVQVPDAKAAELVEFAQSGAPAAPPPWPSAGGVPPVPVPPAVSERPRLVAVSGDGTAAVLPGAGRPSPASPPPGLVVGLAPAAEALGMTLEAFRKARYRRPVPGETTAPDGRPAWPLAALTAWRAARPSATDDAEGVA